MTGYRVSVETTGIKELDRAFKQAPALVSKQLRSTIRDAANDARNAVSGYAPKRYGALRASIHTEGPSGVGLAIEAKVGTNLEYARYQEEGTGIYGPRKQIIRPVRAKMLSWTSGGKRIFARQVRGVRPQYFFKRGFEDARRQMPGRITALLNGLTRELSR